MLVSVSLSASRDKCSPHPTLPDCMSVVLLQEATTPRKFRHDSHFTAGQICSALLDRLPHGG
jgi:hypothetical protein